MIHIIFFPLPSEVDSDGDEMPEDDEEIKEYYGYRVWYSLELHVKPAAPEKVLEVTCACQVGKQILVYDNDNNSWFLDLSVRCLIDERMCINQNLR